MNYFSKMIELYMRVNNLSRPQMAHMIKIPASALRRLHEGKPIKSNEIITIVDWLFAEWGPRHTELPDGE